jgi:hypothetical protein
MPLTTRALAFATNWFDPATVHQVFEPLVADWQREWESTPAPRRWTASLSGLRAFIVATVVSFPRLLLTPAPTPMMNEIVTRVARYTLLPSLMLILPFVLDTKFSWPQAWMIPFLVPQALTAAFPFAMVPAVDAIRRHEGLPPHVARATVMKCGISAVLLMIVFHGWVTPAANQAWRQATFEATIHDEPVRQHARRTGLPARGSRELSTLELIVDPSHRHAGLTTNIGARSADLRRELNNRASLAALPALFLWLRWRSFDLPRGRWRPLPAIVAFLAIGVSYAAIRGVAEDQYSIPRSFGAWLAPLTMLAFTRAAFWLRRRRVVQQ